MHGFIYVTKFLMGTNLINENGSWFIARFKSLFSSDSLVENLQEITKHEDGRLIKNLGWNDKIEWNPDRNTFVIRASVFYDTNLSGNLVHDSIDFINKKRWDAPIYIQFAATTGITWVSSIVDVIKNCENIKKIIVHTPDRNADGTTKLLYNVYEETKIPIVVNAMWNMTMFEIDQDYIDNNPIEKSVLNKSSYIHEKPDLRIDGDIMAVHMKQIDDTIGILDEWIDIVIKSLKSNPSIETLQITSNRVDTNWFGLFLDWIVKEAKLPSTIQYLVDSEIYHNNEDELEIIYDAIRDAISYPQMKEFLKNTTFQLINNDNPTEYKEIPNPHKIQS